MPEHIDQVLLEETSVHHCLFTGEGPQGTTHQNRVDFCQFMLALRQRMFATYTMSLGPAPQGLLVRDVHQEQGMFVVLLEVEPTIRSLTWLADDSPQPYGLQATYQTVTVALPWQYFFVAIHGNGTLAHSSVYFRRAPLDNLQDDLLECAYYNCSPDSYGLRCWICDQYVSLPPVHSVLGMAAVFVEWFFASGFNASSEEHEGDSFWAITSRQTKDGNLKTVKAWQEASKKRGIDFALKAGWVPSQMTPETVYGQIAQQGCCWQPTCAADIATLITQLAAAERKNQRKKGKQ